MESLVLLLLSVSSGVISLTTEDNVFAWEDGTLTIPCHYNKMKYKSHVKYLCKGYNWNTCSIVAQTDNQSTESKIRIHDDKEKGIFTVTLNRLKTQDTDSYYCGIEIYGPDEGAYLHLKVTPAPSLLWKNIGIIIQEGEEVSVHCPYSSTFQEYEKRWCKGAELDSCKTLAQSDIPNLGKNVTLIDNQKQMVFTVNISHLETNDSGPYWCVFSRNGVTFGSPLELNINATPSRILNKENVNSERQHTSGASLSKEEKAVVYVGVLGGLLLIFLVSIILYVRKRNDLKKMKPQMQTGDGQQNPDDSEETAYSSLSFQHRTESKKDFKNPEENDDIAYSNLSFQQRKKSKKDFKHQRILNDDVDYTTVEFHKNKPNYASTEITSDPHLSIYAEVVNKSRK
ncbi:polymeric immunoglobulin receptor-like isoform X3 [Erpetoichthys calabaricus]|uniref:Polymeric immunoglobulin receptor-like n=1 Tax=Erpetoichthys calabaricus TaxID=27687 RepID=A0A8C4XAK3_ERPCA|nr:polymeric immunoglobulin receptor-like isoform X3 [Erpetoichthys calabaricus]